MWLRNLSLSPGAPGLRCGVATLEQGATLRGCPAPGGGPPRVQCPVLQLLALSHRLELQRLLWTSVCAEVTYFKRQ